MPPFPSSLSCLLWTYLSVFSSLPSRSGKRIKLEDKAGKFTTEFNLKDVETESNLIAKIGSYLWLDLPKLALPFISADTQVDCSEKCPNVQFNFESLPPGVKALCWQALGTFVDKLGKTASRICHGRKAILLCHFKNSFQVTKMCSESICKTKIIHANHTIFARYLCHKIQYAVPHKFLSG